MRLDNPNIWDSYGPSIKILWLTKRVIHRPENQLVLKFSFRLYEVRTMLPVFICKHWDVEWLDAHTCCCNECGKLGQWYEDGLVIWCRRPRKSDFRTLSLPTIPSVAVQTAPERFCDGLVGLLPSF